MLLQTYVILIEYHMNLIGLVYTSFELLFGIKAYLDFKKVEKTQWHRILNFDEIHIFGFIKIRKH